jgi:hypothetical protein
MLCALVLLWRNFSNHPVKQLEDVFRRCEQFELLCWLVITFWHITLYSLVEVD